jgi:putative transposase
MPLYRDFMAERCRANAVACWAYCLTPNPVHLILVPSNPVGLAKAVGEAHRPVPAGGHPTVFCIASP